MKCEEQKFIFIDITKNAGTAIIKSFMKEYPHNNYEGKHHSIPNFTSPINWPEAPTCTHITEQDIEQNTLFTVIRNPWDRMVSLYFWGIKSWYFDCKNFKDFIRRANNNDYKEYNQHRYRRQIEWISNENGDIIVKNILFFENLQRDFDAFISSKIKIPNFKILKRNTAKQRSGIERKHYTEYYDKETIEIVAEKYAKDIEYFGYEFAD